MTEYQPLVAAALAEFAPRGSEGNAASLRLDSPGVVRVNAADAIQLMPAAAMPRWVRQRLRAAENAQTATGMPTIFLAEHLATYQKPGETWHRGAPRNLAPVHYNDETRTFTIIGDRSANHEFAALLQAGHASLIGEDPQFRAIVIISPGARNKLRLVNPAENPSFLSAPAVRRLLGEQGLPQAPTIADRPAALKKQRRTPLDEDQERAYQLALTGSDLIVFGPPGTGKSEVIAEVARAALEAGRRVLIASSVESALGVARKRLAATDHTEQYAACLAFQTPDDFAIRPASEPAFDLLIVDEAARTTVSEALMLASRAKQIIVCGDPRQLSVPDGRPNLYKHAAALDFPSIMLRKHYRSQTGDLILFSNASTYRMQLRMAPSPALPEKHGVRLATCLRPELKSMPGGLMNQPEARAVAQRLAEYAAQRDPRSLGVVALTLAQAQAIREAIAALGLTSSMLSPNTEEPFFVRTISQAQGEERDCVLVSMTFAPVAGTMSKCLTVFEKEGQTLERLNVALSRARSRTEVFASFTAADLIGKPSRGRTVFQAFFALYDAAVIGLRAFKPAALVELAAQFIRRDGDRLDNLGVLHGWTRPQSTGFDLGLLIRWDKTPRPIWDIAEAQLRVAGWKLAIFDQAELENDIGRVQEEIERAARRP